MWYLCPGGQTESNYTRTVLLMCLSCDSGAMPRIWVLEVSLSTCTELQHCCLQPVVFFGDGIDPSMAAHFSEPRAASAGSFCVHLLYCIPCCSLPLLLPCLPVLPHAMVCPLVPLQKERKRREQKKKTEENKGNKKEQRKEKKRTWGDSSLQVLRLSQNG